MNCPTCNKLLDDNAKFCGVCGTKIEANSNVVLTVSRTKKIMGFAIPFTIFVDNTELGKLKNGGKLTCNVGLGKHKVIFKCVEKNVEQEIEVTPSTNAVEVVCHAKIGLLAAVAKIDKVNYS